MISYLRSTIAIRYTAQDGSRQTIAVSRGEVVVVIIGLMVIGAFVVRDAIRLCQQLQSGVW